MEPFVCLGIESSVQPVLFIVELDHGFVNRNVIRIGTAQLCAVDRPDESSCERSIKLVRQRISHGSKRYLKATVRSGGVEYRASVEISMSIFVSRTLTRSGRYYR